MGVHIIDCVQFLDEMLEDLKLTKQWKTGSADYKKGLLIGIELSQEAIKEFNDEFVGD